MSKCKFIENFFDLLRANKLPSSGDLRALDVVELELISNAIGSHIMAINNVAASKEARHD